MQAHACWAAGKLHTTQGLNSSSVEPRPNSICIAAMLLVALRVVCMCGKSFGRATPAIVTLFDISIDKLAALLTCLSFQPQQPCHFF
jgi:hypothetical protein